VTGSAHLELNGSSFFEVLFGGLETGLETGFVGVAVSDGLSAHFEGKDMIVRGLNQSRGLFVDWTKWFLEKVICRGFKNDYKLT
jgi:hypothetical protein